jgi:hypothetical protein
MSRTPNHLRPRREKVFGPARGIPLDRNAKARIMVYVQGYNARMKQEGQLPGADYPRVLPGAGSLAMGLPQQPGRTVYAVLREHSRAGEVQTGHRV